MLRYNVSTPWDSMDGNIVNAAVKTTAMAVRIKSPLQHFGAPEFARKRSLMRFVRSD